MFVTKNGWTKARMIEQLKLRVPPNGCVDDSPEVKCVYRKNHDPHGAACAVGAFIPDEVYRPEFDTSGNGFDEIYTEIGCHMPLSRFGMSKLQNEHDVVKDNTLERLIAWVNAHVEDADATC